MTEPHEQDILAATEAIVDEYATTATRLAARRRRLRRALYDLGLTGVLGPHWCQIGDDGFEFEPITGRQADRLTSALEELAGRLPPRPRPLPGPGQGSLFDF